MIRLPSVQEAQAFMVIGSGGGGDVSSCTADSEIAPDTDTLTTGWSTTGTYYYDQVDDPRGSEETEEYIQEMDNGDDNDLVLAFPLPGDCDVDDVTVYFYGYTSGGDMDIYISVSDDNSTWETNMSTTVVGNEHSFAFTTLNYSTPSDIYVRIQLLDTSWATLNFQNIAIVVNPS